MNIFTRKPKKPIITQPEPDEPFTSVEPARQVPVELLQKCASCGTVGATLSLKVSYFGYLELNVLICDTCEVVLKLKKDQHNVDMHRKPIAAKETVEVTALARPRKKRLVTMRTPSRPLEDRAVNLALEA
jgi:hypothetical protein